eukprot:TRINITY_DN1118_c0_g2_i2.p1 TRINITY_DN1118_c0_g2~~TRINITY_DN1118_c0_g2_i2.p1  ORF type:complete len:436 (-),score=77.18 TRINITY_DN1118_c0_g2_i2:718-2025(-)
MKWNEQTCEMLIESISPYLNDALNLDEIKESMSESDWDIGSSLFRFSMYEDKTQTDYPYELLNSHTDVGYLTVACKPNISGLWIMDTMTFEWIHIDDYLEEGDVAVMVGESLSWISNQILRPTRHCVMQSHPGQRLSIVYLYRPLQSKVLDSKYGEISGEDLFIRVSYHNSKMNRFCMDMVQISHQVTNIFHHIDDLHCAFLGGSVGAGIAHKTVPVIHIYFIWNTYPSADIFLRAIESHTNIQINWHTPNTQQIKFKDHIFCLNHLPNPVDLSGYPYLSIEQQNLMKSFSENYPLVNTAAVYTLQDQCRYQPEYGYNILSSLPVLDMSLLDIMVVNDSRLYVCDLINNCIDTLVKISYALNLEYQTFEDKGMVRILMERMKKKPADFYSRLMRLYDLRGDIVALKESLMGLVGDVNEYTVDLYGIDISGKFMLV